MMLTARFADTMKAMSVRPRHHVSAVHAIAISEQRKLQVDQIRSQHLEIQRRRDRVDAAIGGRESDFQH